jgi:hypothetical protein
VLVITTAAGAERECVHDVPHSRTPHSLSNLTYQSQALPEYIRLKRPVPAADAFFVHFIFVICQLRPCFHI